MNSRNMKRFASIACALGLTVASATWAAPAAADSQDAEQLARLVKELQAQQLTIAANQAKIDEKLALVAEAVRQAKVFVSRPATLR